MIFQLLKIDKIAKMTLFSVLCFGTLKLSRHPPQILSYVSLKLILEFERHFQVVVVEDFVLERMYVFSGETLLMNRRRAPMGLGATQSRVVRHSTQKECFKLLRFS